MRTNLAHGSLAAETAAVAPAGKKQEGKFSFSWRVEFRTAHELVGKNNLNCLLLFSIYTSACCLTILNYNTEKKIIVLKNTWYLIQEIYS